MAEEERNKRAAISAIEAEVAASAGADAERRVQERLAMSWRLLTQPAVNILILVQFTGKAARRVHQDD